MRLVPSTAVGVAGSAAKRCSWTAPPPYLKKRRSLSDFTAAKRFVKLLNPNGELSEATLFGFAKERKYEETVAALAVLSQSTVEVIRPLMHSLRDDGVLIPCKVAELNWETVRAILESRFATGSMAPNEFEKAKESIFSYNK
jgi:hypothetical protein